MTIPDISSSHIAYDIALTLIEGVGPRAIDSLLETFGSAYRLFTVPDSEIESRELTSATAKALIFGRRRKMEHAYSIFEQCTRSQIRILIKGTPDYPKLLEQCPDAPYVLYCRGSINFNAHKIISCVGTRNADSRGIDLCQKHIRDIAQALPDVAIASGLARGIDAACHRSAIESSLPTIAVMPGWVDDITPRSHYALARSIVEKGGAIVCDMPPGTAITPSHFISRNRIIAGLSHATIMMQSALTGGSMITADMANGYDREVFAPAADPADPSFAGNINLIRSDRAIMLQNVTDICTVMGWEAQIPLNQIISTINMVDTLEPDQLTVYAMLPETEPFAIDQIIDQSQMPIAKVSSILTLLEVKGLVTTLKGRLYIKTNL